MASVGQMSVKIKRPPVIGLLSTGNELVDADTVELPAGKIRDSNKVILRELLANCGIYVKVIDLGKVGDTEQEIDDMF